MTKIRNYTSRDQVFKSLQQLAIDNPQEFEIKRDELISEFMDTLPEKYQKRMHCLQWRINQTRDLAKTPLAACIAISNMMFDSVNKLHKEAREFQLNLTEENNEYQFTSKPLAKVLDFKFIAAKTQRKIYD